MGLIKAAAGAVGGVLADQWKEYFYCDALDENVMATKGEKRTGRRSSNTKGSDNIISNGSVIAVADGQCMLIVEQGKVVEVCAEPGEFVYDTSTEPSIFAGSLGESIGQTFKNIGKRFTFGGEPPKDQRVYYFNTKEMIGNKYGTPSPITFRVVDERANIDMDIPLRCFGEYSFKITNPLLFYTGVCGNISEDYRRDRLESQMRSELLTALQPALGRISEQGIRYYALMSHTTEIRDGLKEELSKLWGEGRGIEIVNFGISSMKADEKVEAELREMQREAAYLDPARMASRLGNAQAEAMKAAAANTGAGPAMAFMGMNMAGQAGGGAAGLQGLYQQQAAQQAAAPAPAAPAGWTCACGHTGNTGKFCSACGKPRPAPKESWTCQCGTVNTGKFCSACGKPKPAPQAGWTCECGAVNKGRFCSECGKPKPRGVPQYKCDKCGWEPEDPAHPPKFCPECGDPFGDEDIK